MSWDTLPADIRLMIFEAVADELINREPTYREWQRYFEHSIFSELSLDQDRISEFNKIMTRTPRRQGIRQNNLIFTKALRSLFAVLSAWPAREIKSPGQRGGLALDIKPRSPAAPKVKDITTLVWRRQSYRGIDLPSLQDILKSIPKICQLVHEPWYNVTRGQQRYLFEEPYIELVRALPAQSHLRNVFIFQDSSRILNPDKPVDGHGANRGLASKCPLGHALAKATRLCKLEVVSASFLIDAFDFFHLFEDETALPRQPNDPRAWDNLRELNLTSDRLTPCRRSWKRQQVLCRAGRAAALMSRLKSMTLWNGGKGFCYIMRYNRTSEYDAPLFQLASNLKSVVSSDFSPQVLSNEGATAV
ncbi:hypothetical protein B0T16DRAFT_514723 [Cercophora newfieldiana]|uniref:DUF6546 domain-containing protein n=1 Tax=Cercophora newfieldiana TaxID=92897 RepID=A0AA40CKG2_9PEZI|nr:hypothetical protein B0T16DRAFT_514723 [Cercophora newfieldiana]